MLDVVKIAVVFASILLLLRLKLNIGYVLLIASGLLAALYLMPPRAMLSTVKATVTDRTTISLFFALTLIKTLELILRENQVLAKMMEAARNLLRKKKAVIVSMPMLIGLLPSLGGAYFSAPMVDEATKRLRMPAEEKAFINYWFRHPWEYVLPLYPGVLLASAVTGIELRSLILANAVYALLLLVTGFSFSMRDLRTENPPVTPGKPLPPGLRRFRSPGLWSFLPVVLVLVLVIILHVELHYALGITIALLFLFFRAGPKYMLRSLKHGFTGDVIILIFGTMLFKFTMEGSGAVIQLSRYFAQEGIPLLPVIFILPFVAGMLTGLTVGFVGSTFPLIISLAGGAHLNQITFAFASGFLGVLLSPVHLCLVLTREYFKADAWGVYKRTIPASAIILLAALGEYFIL